MYRFLTTGTLEESIYQRQIFKGALYDLIHDSNEPSSSAINPAAHGHNDNGRYGTGSATEKMGGEAPEQLHQGLSSWSREGTAGGARSRRSGQARGFSQEELRELFVLKSDTNCDTYDKLTTGGHQSTKPNGDTGGGEEERGEESGKDTTPAVGNNGNDMVETTACESPAGKPGSMQYGRGGREGGRASSGIWEEYKGPGRIADEPLRQAILDVQGQAQGVKMKDLVTFVHEVKRGNSSKHISSRVGDRPP